MTTDSSDSEERVENRERCAKAEGAQVGVRWTVGDVSALGFEALRFSILGAGKIFGAGAEYVVCVNSIPVAEARELTGDVPENIHWRRVDSDVPDFLRARLGRNMAEGVGWKFAPLELFQDRYGIALDNDCILWRLPGALSDWLAHREPSRCVIAEDVRPCFGKFSGLCGAEPRNSGIRGLPPGFDFESALRAVLEQTAGILDSELDEQGLQVAALRPTSPYVVSLTDVSICSPFPPHQSWLGCCGAHFVGLNVRELPWNYNGRLGSEHVREHWARYREEIFDRVAPE